MFRKLILFLILLSVNLSAMEIGEEETQTLLMEPNPQDDEIETLTTELDQQNIEDLIDRTINFVIAFYSKTNSKTAREFIEFLDNLINWRLVRKSFARLTRENIIDIINNKALDKGTEFLESTTFSAFYHDKLNITPWLRYGLVSTMNNSISDILLTLIANKFSLESQQSAVDKLIGLSYSTLNKILHKSNKEVKTLTFAMLYVIHYTSFDQNALKNELIDRSIQAFYEISYAPEAFGIKATNINHRILLKFLAKLYGLGYLNIKKFESIWNLCFEEYNKNNRTSITREIHLREAELTKNALIIKSRKFQEKHKNDSKNKSDVPIQEISHKKKSSSKKGNCKIL